MASREKETIFWFSTSRLADDSASEIMGLSLHALLANYEAKVCSTFGISGNDRRWGLINPFRMMNGDPLPTMQGLSDEFEEFRPEVISYVQEFVAAHPIDISSVLNQLKPTGKKS